MYAFTEAGAVGAGCAHPVDGNDLHLMKDTLALIQHPRRVPGSGIEVPAFYFTALLPTVPKILINVESDDYGIVEQRRCGCPLEDAGYPEHIREVRSFRKLTGEGVTLVGSDMERILEQVLPSRFGGGPLDYQLIERENDRGQTKLVLFVDPRVEIVDEQAIIETLYDELSRGDSAADIARAFWQQGNTLTVERAAPVWTGRGKLMPLHLDKKGRGPAAGHQE
jgi:hypothetical protein